MQRTTEQWLLVTGGARRVGRAIALGAARDGWNVAVHYHRSRQDAQDTVTAIQALGGRAVAVAADLDDAAAVDGLIPATVALTGSPLLGLVNSASHFAFDDIATIDAASFAAHMTPNTLAPVLLARGLARQIPAGAQGALINLLDFKLTNPNPDYLAYTLSKYALAGATRLLARALAPHVRVNGLSPGYVLPAPGQSDTDFQARARRNPLAIPPSLDDLVAAALFLLNSRTVTGQEIAVDCGLHFLNLPGDIAHLP